MKKNITTKNSYTEEYKHGNLMLISTSISICSLMALMLLTTAFKSTFGTVMFGRIAAAILSGGFFIAFIATAYFAKTKDKSLWEYSIYSLIMAFGFLSLLGIPFFLPKTPLFMAIFKTKYAQAGAIGFNVVYLIVSLIYHTYISSKTK